VHHSNLIRTESNDGHHQYSTPKSSQVISNSNPFLSDTADPHNDTNNNLLKAPTIKVKNSDANSNFFKIDSLIVSTGDNDDADDKSQMSHESRRSKKNSDVSPKSLSSIHSSMTTMVKSEPATAAAAAKNINNNNNIKSNSYFNNSSSNNPNDDEDDHIDWASSEDDEIVKQEVESFERNQVNTMHAFKSRIN
jgi:hypothetical protein